MISQVFWPLGQQGDAHPFRDSTQTARGELVVEEAFGVAMAEFGKLFAAFSREELAALTALLNRVRDEFMPPP